MNFFKMTIKDGNVFRMKAHWESFGLSHGQNKVSFFLSPFAKPIFSGTNEECLNFIKQSGAELA